MYRLFALLFVFVGFISPALAQTSKTLLIPERRLVVTRDIDFYGSDLQALFDTTQSACATACLVNTQCKAFTFNSRSNSCFPKSNVTEKQPYEGAISAVVIERNQRIRDLAETRAPDLVFLSSGDLSQARNQAATIGSRHLGGQWDLEAILSAANDRRNAKKYVDAMRWIGAAVAQSDAPDQWVEYGRLSLAIKTNRSSDKRKYASRALHASINGYLRSGNIPGRVNALLEMARALERAKRGRDMIGALRLAEKIQPRADVAAALDKAIAKYGFRIKEHIVENNQADPQICAEFSEALIKKDMDYAPYLRLPDQRMSVTANGNRICLGGVEHGKRYSVTFREGLPAQSGEKLVRDVELTLYVQDREPFVRFPGRAYVLPKSTDAALPIETVNLDKVDLILRRVSDRNLLRAIQEGLFGRSLSYHEARLFSGEIGEDVWTGEGEVNNTLNQEMKTRLPIGDVIADLPAGVYALSASIEGESGYDSPGATQWFVLSDLGISTMSGVDGLHVFVRGLGDAAARGGITATLLSRSNRVLGTAQTDDRGYVRFEPGLTRGKGGARPALIMVQDGEADMAFLSLRDPAFDLSDRGVEGREPGKPIDLFLTTDRGAYRTGEVVNATVLARDAATKAIMNLPLTAILTRPDGVEYARHFSPKGVAGGHVFNMPVGATVPRGTWRLDIKADVDAQALESRTFLVEDFLPERIDFEMSLPDTPIRPSDTPVLTVDAKYLFGAPGGNLPIEGDVTLFAKREITGFPGYRFGRYDTRFNARRSGIDRARTDDNGHAEIRLDMPTATNVNRPLGARIVLRVSEGSGRPVERSMTRDLAPDGPMIGIKKMFEDVVREGSEAAFEIIAIGPEMTPVAMKVNWTINRVNTRYQWYRQYGNWKWERTTNRVRVKSGEAMLGDAPIAVSAGVDWGHYELVVERADGANVSGSSDFYAGWYAPADTSKTPDTLELSLDKPGYKNGDTAVLRVVPRYAGTALISVMSNRLIAMKTVQLSKGENKIPLDVTEEWGAGAYVTATIIRPMDVAAGQNPARAIGLSYAAIDPGKKQLSVMIETPAETAPRGPLNASVIVDGVAPGDTAYVTVAAVDVGILNLTGFKSPDPSTHYFRQRRLGMDIRDIYGRLIDGMSGDMGAVRSGGDGAIEGGMQSPPPTEELVAYFSGLVTVGPDGRAHVNFDMPEFNGTVRLMAVAWSSGAVGQGEADVLVRDPVVVTASLPRFLAPDDQSRMLLEIVHADGPTGRMGLDVTAEGVALDLASVPSGFDLGDNEKYVLSIPITAARTGDHSVRVALTTPDGKQLVKTLVLPVRVNDPEVAITQRFSLGRDKTFSLDSNVFAQMRPGTGSAILSAGPLAKLDAPGLLSALDRYPYGCTEQVTSVALPLLYFGQVAEALGQGNHDQVQARIDQAIERVLTRQSSNGAFGLWRPGSGDFWLDAYVTDFLSRAQAQGYDVPKLAFRLAMDNLRNRVNYAPDFDEDGGDIAYALMVLAREGAAAMADLRYYADVKADAFTTPIGAAQIGAALAMYGDQTRADAMFSRAARIIKAQARVENPVWRVDYGTNLRDAAAVLTLAVEAGSEAIDRGDLINKISGHNRSLSTQESTWSLLAARALVSKPAIAGLSVNGVQIDGPLVKVLEDDTIGRAMEIRNGGGHETDVTLTTFGVPRVTPAAGGYGYAITREYYTMDGDQVTDLSARVGERYVVVLYVKPFEKGQARLMVNDPLPAGFEIDNPNVIRSGDISALDWLKTTRTKHTEFRSDRFLAAVDWRSSKPFQLAYIVRAISPGEYHYPAAQVEDMYRPQYRAHTDTGRIVIYE